VQFVLCYTKEGFSSSKSLISHLKSKHRIHVIHESEDHKTIPAQKEIRSQIVMKEMSLFKAAKKRSNNPEKLYHALITANIIGTRGIFQPRGYLSQTHKHTES